MNTALLPPSASELERASAEVFAQRANLPVRIGDLWNPDACPAEQLPWLAWALSVDRWFPDWTENQRRQAIAASYEVHRHKGTPAAVKAALSVLGHPVQLVEWYQTSPPGAPYTFSVEVMPGLGNGGITLDDAWFDRVINIANSAKNTRSHLDTVRLVLTAGHPAIAHLGAFTAATDTIDLSPYQPGALEYTTPVFGYLAQMSYEMIDLNPLEAP